MTAVLRVVADRGRQVRAQGRLEPTAVRGQAAPIGVLPGRRRDSPKRAGSALVEKSMNFQLAR